MKKGEDIGACIYLIEQMKDKNFSSKFQKIITWPPETLKTEISDSSG